METQHSTRVARPAKQSRGRTPVPAPSKEELLSLYPRLSTLKIAKLKGVSHPTVRKWCRLYGVPMRPRGIRKGTLRSPEIETDAIVSMTKQGLKRAEIARKLNTSVALVAFRQKESTAAATEQLVFDLRAKQEVLERELAAIRAQRLAAEAKIEKARQKAHAPEEIREAIEFVRKMPYTPNRTAMQALNISEAGLFRWLKEGKLKKYKKGYVYSAQLIQILDRSLAKTAYKTAQ
jgi:hypothetical protein